MVQEILTKITANGRGRIRRTLSATVALVLALAMVASAAFADAGRDPAVQGDDALLESSGEACGCGSISASANPSMEVALWYVQPELSFLIASRALRHDPEDRYPGVDAFRAEDASFIHASRQSVTDDTSIDITHESLIRQWTRLDAWVREEAASYEVYHDLYRAAGALAERAGIGRRPVRLLGLGAGGLEPGDAPRQLGLEGSSWGELERVVDRVRGRSPAPRYRCEPPAARGARSGTEMIA